MDRGSELLRRGQNRTGVADLLLAVEKRPSLIASVLTEVERRTAERPTVVEQEAACEVCQQVLEKGVRTLFELPF